MKKIIILWVFVTALSISFISTQALAKGRGKGTPPGWDKGEKKEIDNE